MCNLPFAKSRSRPDQSQRKAKLHKRIVFTNYAVPTGALDYATSKEILKLIEQVNRKYGNTVVMVTHNNAIEKMADRVVKLHDGRIRENCRNETRMAAEDLEW